MEPKKWDWTTDLVDTIITKVNQQQIRIQVRKSIRSKRKLFSDGCYMKGDPPFGYKLENKRLVPDEDRKEWVQKIYRWYDDGMTTTQIQKILFENSIFPPRYSISNNKWFPLETIVNILSNQNYIGIDVYGDFDKSVEESYLRRFEHADFVNLMWPLEAPGRSWEDLPPWSSRVVLGRLRRGLEAKGSGPRGLQEVPRTPKN